MLAIVPSYGTVSVVNCAMLAATLLDPGMTEDVGADILGL